MQRMSGFVLGVACAALVAWNIYEVRERDAMLMRHDRAIQDVVTFLNKTIAQQKGATNEKTTTSSTANPG